MFLPTRHSSGIFQPSDQLSSLPQNRFEAAGRIKVQNLNNLFNLPPALPPKTSPDAKPSKSEKWERGLSCWRRDRLTRPQHLLGNFALQVTINTKKASTSTNLTDLEQMIHYFWTTQHDRGSKQTPPPPHGNLLTAPTSHAETKGGRADVDR